MVACRIGEKGEKKKRVESHERIKQKQGDILMDDLRGVPGQR